MNEFNNRIDIQRRVIKIVNSSNLKHQISGLSRNSIERWVKENNIVDEEKSKILKDISSKLFFLGTKSQEQITEDYKNKSIEVSNLIDELEKAIVN
jgi:hypothetical protein